MVVLNLRGSRLLEQRIQDRKDARRSAEVAAPRVIKNRNRGRGRKGGRGGEESRAEGRLTRKGEKKEDE